MKHTVFGAFLFFYGFCWCSCVYLWRLCCAVGSFLGPLRGDLKSRRVARPREGLALANHIESFAGDGDRADVSATFLQPFLTYITAKQTTFAINTESTYDWETEQWSVPLNLQASQLLKLGGQHVQVGGGVRYWLDSPSGGPDGWGLRMNLVLVFPRP